MKKSLLNGCLAAALFATASLAQAAGKTYTEDQFISTFSGKSSKSVTEILGNPAKKEQSVKPGGADDVLAGRVRMDTKKKPARVEMWYYKNLVKYDKTHTYKRTEVTMVNDRVASVAFFND